MTESAPKRLRLPELEAESPAVTELVNPCWAQFPSPKPKAVTLEEHASSQAAADEEEDAIRGLRKELLARLNHILTTAGAP